MKRLTAFIALLLFSPTRDSFAQTETDVEGYWKTIDDSSRQLRSVVRLWVQNGKLVGRILRTFPKPGEEHDPDKTCKQCEGRLKDQRIRGMIFLWGFKPDQDDPNIWVDGEIVDPESGEQLNLDREVASAAFKTPVAAARPQSAVA